MQTEFSEHITHNFPFLKSKKLLIAVSGGLDSVVLSHLMVNLSYSVSLAHCNFKLRNKESDLDAEFVRGLAKNLKCPFYVKLFDTKGYATREKVSIQVAARELRYQWFEEILKEDGFDFVLTAHQANDNLETFLINSIRGTGLDGLLGIPEKNQQIIRPLLPFSRATIESYAKETRLIWREDSSNSETKYLRNKIRHSIIPVLEDLNPNLLATFKNTLDHLKGTKQIVTDRVDQISNMVRIEEPGLVKFDIKKIKELAHPYAYLYELLKTYGFTEWNDIYSLLNAQSGKQVYSSSHRLIKDREFLLLSSKDRPKEGVDTVLINLEEGSYPVVNFTLKLTLNTTVKVTPNSDSTALVDREKLKLPLIVRKWKTGDYFYPLGMKGKKKLSKFFKDEKLSLLEKEKIWLLCSDNEIVWIIGKRLDDRFKITNSTAAIVKIECLL